MQARQSPIAADGISEGSNTCMKGEDAKLVSKYLYGSQIYS
jgi:hypothetical protein